MAGLVYSQNGWLVAPKISLGPVLPLVAVLPPNIVDPATWNTFHLEYLVAVELDNSRNWLGGHMVSAQAELYYNREDGLSPLFMATGTLLKEIDVPADGSATIPIKVDIPWDVIPVSDRDVVIPLLLTKCLSAPKKVPLLIDLSGDVKLFSAFVIPIKTIRFSVEVDCTPKSIVVDPEAVPKRRSTF